MEKTWQHPLVVIASRSPKSSVHHSATKNLSMCSFGSCLISSVIFLKAQILLLTQSS